MTRLSYVLSASLLMAGCTDAPLEPEIADLDDSTWETISEKILAKNCAETCHVEGASFARQSDLVLTPDVSYAQLLDVTPKNVAAEADGLVRVSSAGTAGGVEKSFLWEKINVPNEDHFHTDHPFYGALMPLGSPPLTYGELEYIRQWIRAGAPETGEVADRSLLEDSVRYSSSGFTPLPPPASGIQLRVGPFEVVPQFEREFFYYEPLEFASDLLVKRIEVSMRPGSHHFILYTFNDQIPARIMPMPRTLRDLRNPGGDLNTANFGPMAYHVFFAGTQWPRLNYHFPPGVALRLPRGKGLDLNAHYVNRGNASFEGEVHVNLHEADPADVAHVAEVLVMNNVSITLPPRKVTTLEATFPILERMNVFQLFSHAHEHMTEFKVQIVGGARNGEVIYLATDWEHPPILELDPPLVLEPGQALKLITTYNNDSDRTLQFGLLSEDEMMILFGYFYRD